MALLLVLLSTILAFSLASTEQHVPSPDSNINLNVSGDWNITGDAGRLSEIVQQGTNNGTEELFSLHDTSMRGALQPTAAATTTTTPTPTTTRTPPTTTRTTPPTVTTRTPPPTTTTTTTRTTPTTSTRTPTTTRTTPPTATTSTRTPTAATTTIRTTTTTPRTTATTRTPTAATTTSTRTPPATTTTTTTPTTPITTTLKPCPQSGYELFPGFNCYKAFPTEGKSWNEARERCLRDGGDLIVMETQRERKEVYIKLYNRLNFYDFPWVGVYIPQGEKYWTSVNGEPALSTWWENGTPNSDSAGKCARAHANGLIVAEDCATPTSFICEISL